MKEKTRASHLKFFEVYAYLLSHRLFLAFYELIKSNKTYHVTPKLIVKPKPFRVGFMGRHEPIPAGSLRPLLCPLAHAAHDIRPCSSAIQATGAHIIDTKRLLPKVVALRKDC